MLTETLPDTAWDDAAASPARIRVLHLINGQHYAGAERVQDLLALRLPEFGFDVSFACLKRGHFGAARQSQLAPIFELPMRGKWDPRPILQLAKLLRDHGYALVHSHTTRTALVGGAAAALAGVPLVHHVHSQTSTEIRSRSRNFLNVVVERFSVRKAAAMIAVSESALRYAEKAILGRRLKLVPNGIPSPDELAERPLPHESWTLGTAALFRPRKGLETLLEALALVRTEGRTARLRMIGPFETPDYEAAVRRLAGRLGLDDALEWVGFSRDVPRELGRLDLFVLPSIRPEGLPMVVLEAMAAGVPVIASRVDGATDALGRSDGANACGLLVPPADPQKLAAAIVRMMSGAIDWQELRQRAFRRQRALFSDRTMAKGVAQVYREVLGGCERS